MRKKAREPHQWFCCIVLCRAHVRSPQFSESSLIFVRSIFLFLQLHFSVAVTTFPFSCRRDHIQIFMMLFHQRYVMPDVSTVCGPTAANYALLLWQNPSVLRLTVWYEAHPLVLPISSSIPLFLFSAGRWL